MWHRGIFNLDSLDETEQVQFIMLTTRLIRIYQEQYLQWRDGAMDDKFWGSWEAQLKEAPPGMQAVWERRRHWFDTDFQTHIDTLFAIANDAKPIHNPPTSQS